MATSRSAEATIKGYYYQFNSTIEAFLDLVDEDSEVTIEGVEDFDVKTMTGYDYVQCKYYPASTLTNSTIREPVTLMLEHYLRTKSKRSDLKYTLYGYFKNESGERTVKYDLDRLKAILTYSEGIGKAKVTYKYYETHLISDDDLNSFLKVFAVKVSKEFTSHQQSILDKIAKQFKCSKFEAENYYLNNSLRIILEKAIVSSATDRKLSKRAFLKAIDCSKILFSDWYRRFRDQEKYVQLVKNEIKSLNLFSHGKDRMIVLGKQIDFSSSKMPLKTFVHDVAEMYFKIGKSTITTKPLTFILDIDSAKILKLKKRLIEDRIKFNDGFEGYHFCPYTFCEDPIINKRANGQVISKASYYLRLLSLDIFKKNASMISKAFSVLSITDESPELPEENCNQILQVQYLTELSEVISLIKN